MSSNQLIREQEPKKLWNFFADINAIPRPSKKEKKIRIFIQEFAKSLNLEVKEDSVGNILIKKEASEGYENRKKVVLQAHLDMVCQKNTDTDFNFDTQGIQMKIEGEWVQAKDTTLGADNGIGVATILAILASKDIKHPAIEALFTVDEETGMTGAFGLDKNFLSGDILLNLDTEEDNEIDIGCAGGVDVTAEISYKVENITSEMIGFKIELTGLHGGHSGIEIHKGLGNANKLLNRFLYEFLDFKIQLISFIGGGLRNAIPREAISYFIIPKNYKAELEICFKSLKKEIIEEFKSLEENVLITLSPIEIENEKSLGFKQSKQIIEAIQTAHDGVYKMSPDIENLVEASNNLARVEIGKGKASIYCLTRSSVESSKKWVSTSLKAAFELAGMKVSFSGSYPGWKPNPNSEILKIALDIYEKQNNEKPFVVACHAGLECGIIGEKFPDMDMISFGPTIKGAHSPKERVSIPSVQKFWKYTLDLLENIPKK